MTQIVWDNIKHLITFLVGAEHTYQTASKTTVQNEAVRATWLQGYLDDGLLYKVCYSERKHVAPERSTDFIAG